MKISEYRSPYAGIAKQFLANLLDYKKDDATAVNIKYIRVIFCLFFAIGISLFFIIIELQLSPFWSSVISASSILSYSGVAYLFSRKDKNKTYYFEIIGNTSYYLGFLYTLISLMISISSLDYTNGIKTGKIFQNLGFALVTTITGLFVRIICSEFQRPPHEELEATATQLSTETKKLCDEIIRSNDFLKKANDEATKKITDSADNTISATEKLIKGSIEKIGQTLKEFSATATMSSTEILKKLNETTGDIIESIKKQINASISEIDKTSMATATAINNGADNTLKSLDASTKKIASTVQDASNIFVDKINQASNNTDMLKNFVSETTRVTETLLSGFESQIKLFSNSIKSFSEKINKRMEQLDDNLKTSSESVTDNTLSSLSDIKELTDKIHKEIKKIFDGLTVKLQSIKTPDELISDSFNKIISPFESLIVDMNSTLQKKNTILRDLNHSIEKLNEASTASNENLKKASDNASIFSKHLKSLRDIMSSFDEPANNPPGVESDKKPHREVKDILTKITLKSTSKAFKRFKDWLKSLLFSK